MLKPISIKIDTITKQNTADYSNIRKGDTLKFTIKVFQNSTSLTVSSQTIKIILRKSDGYSVQKTVAATGNVIIATMDEQATLAVGEVKGELQFTDTNGTCISNWFTFEVGESLGSDIVTKSKDSIETLQDIQDIIDAFNLTTALDEAIDTGNATKTALNTSKDAANASKTALDSSVSIASETINDLKKTNSEYTTHINNSDVHVTKDKKSEWDANLTTTESALELLDKLMIGSKFTDENGNIFTDENGNIFTIGDIKLPAIITFLSTDWEEVISSDAEYIEGITLYKLTLTHNLSVTDFESTVYNSNNEEMFCDVSVVDANSIKIISNDNFGGKVILE